MADRTVLRGRIDHDESLKATFASKDWEHPEDQSNYSNKGATKNFAVSFECTNRAKR